MGHRKGITLQKGLFWGINSFNVSATQMSQITKKMITTKKTFFGVQTKQLHVKENRNETKVPGISPPLTSTESTCKIQGAEKT